MVIGGGAGGPASAEPLSVAVEIAVVAVAAAVTNASRPKPTASRGWARHKDPARSFSCAALRLSPATGLEGAMT